MNWGLAEYIYINGKKKQIKVPKYRRRKRNRTDIIVQKFRKIPNRVTTVEEFVRLKKRKMRAARRFRKMRNRRALDVMRNRRRLDDMTKRVNKYLRDQQLLPLLPQKHLYHLVDPSPWPFLTGTAALSFLIGVVMYSHSLYNGFFVLLASLCTLLAVMGIWWRDVVREATLQGRHTSVVQRGLRFGMLLFILSEILFFVAFFWGFFHSSLSPNIEIGSIWPPEGISTFNPWGTPFVNTIILLLSGATITWGHHALVGGDRTVALVALEFTIGLAISFTALQIFEYIESPFSISDGIYGSTFFLATGFHGIHVIIGTIMLFIMTGRLYYHHFTKEHHFGFEAAAWYWHFVDVVWLFLFVTIYWWGGL